MRGSLRRRRGLRRRFRRACCASAGAGTPRGAAAASSGSTSRSCSSAQHRGKLRALRAVLHLDREADALLAGTRPSARLRRRSSRSARPSVSSISTESKRSVPPMRNGRVRIAWTMRAGISSPRRQRRASRATTRAPCARAAARTPRRRSRRPPEPISSRGRRSTSRRARGSGAAPDGRAARSRTSASRPSARAASIAACLPEQLLCRRVRRAPGLAQQTCAPRDDSGSCGPQARSPSSRPMSLEHLARDRDVLRLAAVRRARQRELVVAPVAARRSRPTRGAA